MTKEGKRKIMPSLSRRRFLQVGAVATGVAGAGLIDGTLLTKEAKAAELGGSALLNMAVKQEDAPPYTKYPFEGSEKVGRFNRDMGAFASPRLAEKYGMIADKMLDHSGYPKVIDGTIPGFTMLDHALTWASWLPYRGGGPAFSNWEPNPAIPKGPEGMVWQGTPEENSKAVKKAAAVFNAVDCGIGELTDKWLFSRARGKDIVFSEEFEKAEITDTAAQIPASMNRVIMLVVEMNGAMHKYSPSMLSCAAAGDGYARMSVASAQVTEFIRGLGFNAIPALATYSLLVPQAVDCGLGESGRNGLLIHPVYGPNIRLTAIFTDMPLAVDKPISFGAAEFCMTCGKCADTCPSKSLPFGDPTYDVNNDCNLPGMKRWYINADTCIDFWIENGAQDCANCIRSCPYSKPGTWVHNVVKGVSSKTSIFNSIFVAADDALGYGTTYDENNPAEFWSSDERPEKWPRVY